jgi:hypothetical protein
MIEASQRMMTMNSQGEERVEGINPTLKRHLFKNRKASKSYKIYRTS